MARRVRGLTTAMTTGASKGCCISRMSGLIHRAAGTVRGAVRHVFRGAPSSAASRESLAPAVVAGATGRCGVWPVRPMREGAVDGLAADLAGAEHPMHLAIGHPVSP